MTGRGLVCPLTTFQQEVGPSSSSEIREPFDQPALWNLTTPRRFVQESWQQQEQLPRPRCRQIIPGCTCSVSLNECEPHGGPVLTLHERRGTLHDASSGGELGLQIDPVQSCESCPGSCPELQCHWRCLFVLNLTTLWRLRLLTRHAVDTLCVRIPSDSAGIDLSCLQPDWINIVNSQHRELPTVNANVCCRRPAAT